MYIPSGILKRDMEKGGDQSEDSLFGRPQPSQYDDPIYPNNETPTLTSLGLPAVRRSSVSPRDPLSEGLNPQLTPSPTKGLDQGAVIGIAVTIAVIIILALVILDFFILPSRARSAFAKKQMSDLKKDETSSPPTPQPPKSLAKSKPKAKPLPTVPEPIYFSKDIRPSGRRNSFGSGYSSRYSRSMSFDSGVGMYVSDAATMKDLGLSIPRPGYARSWRPWDDDTQSEITAFKNTPGSYNGPVRSGMGVGKWDGRDWNDSYEESIYTIYEDLEEARKLHDDGEVNSRLRNYEGKIKPGMGVQKRHTTVFIREVQAVERFMETQEQQEERDKQNFEMYRRFWKSRKMAGRRLSALTFR
ncbi:hypothetical protein ACMFMF_010858 [Clarireedia jacksonii]